MSRLWPGMDIYPYIKSKDISDKSLNLILEEIEREQYVICESSGEKILLEDAIFMSEDYLISEGVLDKVTEKIQEIIDYIKEGIKKVLESGSDIIKKFCEKVANNKIVVAIRKKLKLDELLNKDKFKSFVNITANNKKIAVESVDHELINEATKLSKKEEAITDPKEIEAIIKKYDDAISGEKEIKNKAGKPLTKKYLQERRNLFKKKLAALADNKSNSEDKTNDNSAEEKSESGNKKEKSSKDKKPVGEISFDIGNFKVYIEKVKTTSISEDTIESATKSTAVAAGR